MTRAGHEAAKKCSAAAAAVVTTATWPLSDLRYDADCGTAAQAAMVKATAATAATALAVFELDGI
eukprot:351290-Chlamydomonas_euryale.AAC.4